MVAAVVAAEAEDRHAVVVAVVVAAVVAAEAEDRHAVVVAVVVAAVVAAEAEDRHAVVVAAVVASNRAFVQASVLYRVNREATTATVSP